MTKIRDDGLETSDPIVASCFLGCVFGDDGESFLDCVGSLTVEFCDSQENYTVVPYPILIPAATVAEAAKLRLEDIRTAEDGLRFIAIITAIGPKPRSGEKKLLDWLRTHTSKEEQNAN